MKLKYALMGIILSHLSFAASALCSLNNDTIPRFSEVPVTHTPEQWKKEEKRKRKKEYEAAAKKYRPAKDSNLESLYKQLGTDRNLVIDRVFNTAKKGNKQDLQKLEQFALKQLGNTTDQQYKELEKQYQNEQITQEEFREKEKRLKQAYRKVSDDIRYTISEQALKLYNNPELTLE